MKRAFLCVALFMFAAIASPKHAHAEFVFSVSENGNNVVVSGYGTLNVTALTRGNSSSQVNPIIQFGAQLANGASGPATRYTGISGPQSFGSSVQSFPIIASGDIVEINVFAGGRDLWVPFGYVSGAPLSNTCTYANATISSLGLTRGTFTYTWGAGSDADSLRLIVGATQPLPLQMYSVASRKSHALLGSFSIFLPLTGAPGVECRNGNGSLTLVFTFTNNVVSGSASVTSGTGTAAAPSFAANTITVNLSGVTDVQPMTVTLTDMADNFGQVLPEASVSFKMLIGDSNGDGTVNAGDAIQTRSRSGQIPDATTFRSDVNVDGAINSADTTIVRARSGNFVP